MQKRLRTSNLNGWTKDKIREIIEPYQYSDQYTFRSRVFDFFIQALIVISLACFCIDTLPGLSAEFRLTLRIVEMVTISLFTLEYLTRVYVAENKPKFIFSFLGLIDLFAILPFYLSFGVDLRALRVLRLFQLLRAFKLLRYSRAIQHFRNALREVKEELILYLLASAFLTFLVSVGIYHFEHPVNPEIQSVFDAMWWAVVTLTTVGYGDVYPVTTGGRIFTAFILVIGLGIISVPSGLIAAGLTKTDASSPEEKKAREKNEDA